MNATTIGHHTLIKKFPLRSRDLSQLSLGGDTDNPHADVDDQNVYNDHVIEIDENIDEDFDEEVEEAENLAADGPEKNEEIEEKVVESESSNNLKQLGIPMEEGSSSADVPNLFVLLPRPTSERVGAKLPPTPTDFELTSEGLPDGWAMQLMKSGRTLFIDNRNQVFK